MRFHLDCLLASMKHQRPIYPEILAVISDGLRSGVDAYAWIRQCVDLRTGTEEPVLPHSSIWTMRTVLLLHVAFQRMTWLMSLLER